MPSSQWATSGSSVAAAATGVAVGSQAGVEAAQATANTALAATVAAGSDGVLSRGEKPGVIVDFNGAAADHALLLAKAQASGVAYSDFTEVYGALRDYMESLSPAYTSTTTDTPINATTWAARWNAWGSAYTDMLVRIASAAPSTVEVIATATQNLTTNAAAPVLDGITLTAGKIVMLPAQSTKSQNGVYQVAYAPPAGAAYKVFPSTWANGSMGGSVTDPALAYDATEGVPNNVTYTNVFSGPEDNNVGEITYSGLSGTNLTGDLKIVIAPFTNQGLEVGSSSVSVLISTNLGQSWSLAGRFTLTGPQSTISVPLAGVTGADVRVKIRAVTTPDFGLDQNHEWVQIGVLTSAARVYSVYFDIPVSGSANWSFVRQAGVPNASVWRSRAGTIYGPGAHYLATVATDGGVTLTTQEAPYEAPLGKPTGGSAFLKRDSAGVNTWEARRFGFPDYASGATRAVASVYQAATDGWLNLVLVGSYMNDIYVYVGSTNNPTTLIWRSGDDINGNTKYTGALLPIPAGTYFKVVSGTYSFETITYRWFPSLA